jgi:hypothetical protein
LTIFESTLIVKTYPAPTAAPVAATEATTGAVTIPTVAAAAPAAAPTIPPQNERPIISEKGIHLDFYFLD